MYIDVFSNKMRWYINYIRKENNIPKLKSHNLCHLAQDY